jgi:long-chain acyl-CoA synthetase
MHHGGCQGFYFGALNTGQALAILGRFDAEETLAAIETYQVTTAYMVPTQFVRLLRLPAEIKASYDVSSLQVVVHSAAPCPVDVKQRMLDWWGPVIWETYGGMEGAAAIAKPHRWLAKPGTVGRAVRGMSLRILDDDGNELPAGEVGTVWFEPPPNRPGFEYHKDEAKTRDSFNKQGWSTVGDMGSLDADGYLYLTDRRTFMIVSGGVNIYPQEAENALIDHPRVYDVAVFGIPDPEMGERVHGVVQPTNWDEAGPELERELLDFVNSQLAHYKCPKAIDFERELPREQTGKLYKRLLRDRYWGDKTSRIV